MPPRSTARMRLSWITITRASSSWLPALEAGSKWPGTPRGAKSGVATGLLSWATVTAARAASSASITAAIAPEDLGCEGAAAPARQFPQAWCRDGEQRASTKPHWRRSPWGSPRPRAGPSLAHRGVGASAPGAARGNAISVPTMKMIATAVAGKRSRTWTRAKGDAEVNRQPSAPLRDT